MSAALLARYEQIDVLIDRAVGCIARGERDYALVLSAAVLQQVKSLDIAISRSERAPNG
jgi:hypothetical protein